MWPAVPLAPAEPSAPCAAFPCTTTWSSVKLAPSFKIPPPKASGPPTLPPPVARPPLMVSPVMDTVMLPWMSKTRDALSPLTVRPGIVSTMAVLAVISNSP